jgi:hypothetical protein
MKRLLSCLCVGCLALCSPALPAQQPGVPLGLSQFPLPREFTPTPQDLNVSGALLNAVRAKFECKKCNGQEPGGRVGATLVKLGALGQAAIVTSYAPDHCTDTGNCSLWLFTAQGEPQQLDTGVSYAIVTTSDKPVPDIAIRGMTGDRTEFVHLFTYLNGRYKATGCLALRDKNDMGDVTISACR